MINFKSYIEYFRGISETHVQLVPDTKKTFLRLNIEEITGSMRTTIDPEKYVMVLESYEHKAKDLHSDNHLRDYTGAFMILKRVPQLDDFNGQDDVIDACEEIAIEISRRMYADSIDFENPNKFFTNIELNDFTFNKVGPLFNVWFGFRCQFDFTDTYNIEVTTAKWNDL